MANEIGYQHIWTGSMLYAVVLDLLGRAWNGAAFEARVIANWGNYDIALAESEAGSYWYAGTFPAAIPDGTYTVLVFERAGAAPAATDELLGTARIQWENGAEVFPATPSAGSGDVLVNHDTGGVDNLRAERGGVGVDEVVIRAYLTADWDAGVHTVRGQARTGTDGRWIAPMYLDAGAYTFVFAKPGAYVTQAVEEDVA